MKESQFFQSREVTRVYRVKFHNETLLKAKRVAQQSQVPSFTFSFSSRRYRMVFSLYLNTELNGAIRDEQRGVRSIASLELLV